MQADYHTMQDERERGSLLRALDLVQEEVERATSKYGQFNSAHEGYAVLLEELDELWDEIKTKQPDQERMAKEAVQVAAMAVRFLVDVCRVKV